MSWRAAYQLAVILLCGLMIGPMLGLSFIGDDVQGSWLPGYFAWEHVSVWSDITRNIGNWLANEGRFFPVSYIYAEYFFSNARLSAFEKPIQLIAVLINVCTMYVVIRRLASHWLAMICTLSFVMMLQIRFWYDPIVAYLVLLPVSLETLLLSVLFWKLASEHRSPHWIVAALAVEVVGLLTYEQTYALFVALAIGAWILIAEPRWKRTVSTLLCVPVLILAVVDVYLRSRIKFAAVDPYSTHVMSNAYMATLGKQMVAALPLSYWIFRPMPPATPTLATLPSYTDLGVILAAGLALLLGFFVLKPGQLPTKRMALALGVTGSAFWIFPAAIISLSPRWQAATILGLGYLNVYVEYVGLAFILTATIPFGLAWIERRWRGTLATRVVGAVALACIVFITAAVNRASCAAFIPIYTAGRNNLDAAFRAGIARSIPANATIVFTDRSYLFQIPNIKYVLFSDSGRKFSVAAASELSNGSLCQTGTWGKHSTCLVKPGVWEYRSTVSSEDQPWVQLARARELVRVDGVVQSIIADRWYVYGDSVAAQHMIDLGGVRTDDGTTERGVYFYDACGGFDSLEPATTNTPGIDLLSGFGNPEYHGVQEFIWSTPEAEMRLHASPLSDQTHVSMQLRSLGPSVVTIRSSGHLFRVPTSPQGARVTIPAYFGTDKTELLDFSITGGPFHVTGDPRTLGMQFNNIRMGWACKK